MKKTLFAAVLAAAALSAAADSYEIDPFHTNARFTIDHFGTSSNVGGFYGLKGTMQFDPAQGSGSIDIAIPLKNLQSSSKEFTHHLLSADIFNAAKHPSARFVSTKFNAENGKVKSVEGKLTLNGQTHPVTLNADKFNCYDSPMKKVQVCGGDFSTAIDRTQWGVSYLADQGMTKTVNLQIQVEAAKAEAKAKPKPKAK